MSDRPHHLVAGRCWSCGALIAFNPDLVPSIPIGDDGQPAIGGARMPLCRGCVEAANRLRAANGEPTWEIPEGAYAPKAGLPE